MAQLIIIKTLDNNNNITAKTRAIENQCHKPHQHHIISNKAPTCTTRKLKNQLLMLKQSIYLYLLQKYHNSDKTKSTTASYINETQHEHGIQYNYFNIDKRHQ